tara:strand:+ start:459 stop:1067 length:609 start_codon:yes stop_codon:yes gene_type:complete
MRPISINSDLTRMLDDYINWFNKKDFDLPMDEKRFGDKDMEYYCSKEYLDHVMSESKKHRGPPEYAKVCDFHLTHKTPQQAREKSLEFCKDLAAYLGAKFTAVHVYYPEGGYMSWHNNWDCPGYNILLSHSDGGGFFKYLTEDGSIETMNDPAGWNAKVGYYGGKDDPYWHCAGSTSPRQTIGFVIPDKDMWEMMIEDISYA